MGYAQQCKKRGIRLSLTWFEARKVWKKKVHGHVRYYKFPDAKDGYQQALAAHALWVSEQVEKEEPTRGILSYPKKMLQWYQLHGEPTGEEGMIAALETALATGERIYPTYNLKYRFPAIPVEDQPFPEVRHQLDQRAKWAERIRTLEETPARPTRRLLTHYIDLYLEGKLAQVKGGKRKLRTYGSLRERFKPLREFIANSTLDDLKEETLTHFYHFCISKSWSGVRQKYIFQTITTLANWVYRQRYTDYRPRNIDDKWEFLEHVENGKRKSRSKFLFTKDDMTKLLDLPKQGKAWALLSLNTGMTQADLTVLQKSDIKDGRLVFSRTKTIRVKNAPVVNYPLWKCTLDALKAAQAKDGDLIFTTKTGTPLITEKLKDDRNISIWDTVSRQWNRWRKEGKIAGKPFKYLRKTGATILGDSEFRVWRPLYLADVPTDVAGIHYDIKEGKIIPEFDKAIQYIGRELGLV